MGGGGGGDGGQLVSVHPEDLRFHVELDRQSYCDLSITNNSENYVAFKVKTTTPKKYFVRPNTGIIRPQDSCIIRVTLQAQKELPPDMQCKDKFLLQSTVVPPNTELDELSPDAFNKDSGTTLEECKLKVVYISAEAAAYANSADEASRSSSSKQNIESESAMRRLVNERDAVIRQTHHLQQELQELLKKRRNRRNGSGFSLKFALLVGLIGLIIGFLLNITSSSPPGKDEL